MPYHSVTSQSPWLFCIHLRQHCSTFDAMPPVLFSCTISFKAALRSQTISGIQERARNGSCELAFEGLQQGMMHRHCNEERVRPIGADTEVINVNYGVLHSWWPSPG